MFTLTALIFSFTCYLESLRHRDLEMHEQVIVDDYLEWLPNHLEDIEPHLPWGKDMKMLKRLERKSRHSNVYVIDKYVLKSTKVGWEKIADAHPFINRIRLYSATKFWKHYFAVYKESRDDAEGKDKCSYASLKFLRYQAQPFGTLCHENAHLLGILNHAVVYEIGEACEIAVDEEYEKRKEECF